MQRRWFPLSVFLALLALTATAARAQAPEMLGYQGVLTLSNGTVVPDGAYAVRFSVWDSPSVGNKSFEQTLQVQVKDGLYNVLLTNQGGWSLTTAFGGSPRYMEVAITSVPAGSGLTPPITLTPRQQIASVPYALVARTTDASAPSGVIQFKETTTSEVVTGTTLIAFDDTIPQITEGTEILSITAEPKAVGNFFVVSAESMVGMSLENGTVVLSIHQVGASDAIRSGAATVAAVGGVSMIALSKKIPITSLAPLTFTLRAATANVAGKWAVGGAHNGLSGFRYFGGAEATTLRVVEYGPIEP